uniref:Parathyroid hormone n=1 Tax=Salarias fasciatus TaxID=181472 RepID=A0A672IG68_SALFA
MFPLRHLEILVLIVFFLSFHTEARPLRKRTISEVQLMHNVQEHKQVGERQDWLQEKLKDVIVSSSKSQGGQSGHIKYISPKMF